MELRQYLAVVRRRWPLVALIVVLTALLSLGLILTQHLTYTAITRLTVRVRNLSAQPPANGQPGFYTYDNYYNWQSSEFLADDYTLIVPSQAFAQRVAALLKDPYRGLDAGAVQGALSADRQHRELTVRVTRDDPGSAVAIAQAVDAALTAESTPGAAAPTTSPITIRDDGLFAVIDPPAGAGSNRSRQYTNAIIASAVGLALGLGLAFLLEYLDNSLRDARDAEQVIGLPILGAIPGRK